MAEYTRMMHLIHKENGRRCQYFPHDGTWRHWDHPKDNPTPGPSERMDYVCRMDHLMIDTVEGPLPWEADATDRGDFGMPGLGTLMRDVNTDTINKIAGSIGMKVDGDRLTRIPKCETTIKEDGVWFDYGETGEHVEPQTNQARRILGTWLPEVMLHFIERNAEYGEEAHVLGVKGQFADINRKVIKLKRYLWDGVPVPPDAEQIDTIAGELIGHLLILIDEMSRDDA